MAGGATTPELVAAVCNQGALGSLAGAMLKPADIVRASSAIRALTDRPFNLNLFVLDDPQPDENDRAAIERALTLLDPIRAELGLAPGAVPTQWCERLSDQLAAVREVRPAVASFTFGVLSVRQVSELHALGSLVIGTATNVPEALAWEACGADMICAQGAEAGAHRGTFIGSYESSLIGTMALVPQITAAVSLPVIAAGGIMDGHALAAALDLGASAAQFGTAFLCCPESGIHPVWKERLLSSVNATHCETVLTRAFSGRLARALPNEYVERMQAYQHVLPAYPLTNALTLEIRQAAAKKNNAGLMSLFAGQGVALSRALPAGRLVRTLAEELAAVRETRD